MAKKTMNKAEERTMQVVMSELKDKIDRYNLESNAAKRNTLEVECKNLVAEYNEMSLWTHMQPSRLRLILWLRLQRRTPTT